MDHVLLTAEVLSVDGVTRLVTQPDCGAVSLFVGTTRDNFQGKAVVRLEYEAYEDMARKEMLKLCAAARQQWRLGHIAIHHRLGVVPVTEASVVIAVSSEHRRESLEAVAHLIDALKASVPIWKKEVYGEGEGEWKQNKECGWAVKEAGKKQDATTTNKRSLEDKEENEDRPNKRIKKEMCDVTIKTEPVDNEDTDEGKDVEEKIKKEEEKREEEENIKEEEDRRREREEKIKEDGRKREEERQREIDNNNSKNKDMKGLEENFVQIMVSKEELDRRISAFQQRKRQEIDALNVQEFCPTHDAAPNTCARTSAVVLKNKGSTSHLKLTKVVNEWGPQTLGIDPGSLQSYAINAAQQKGVDGCGSGKSTRESSPAPAKPGTRTDPQPHTALPQGLEERLGNLERHLVIPSDGPVPRDVYARLRAVEDRLLRLEGMSPEYFGDKKMKIQEKNPFKKELKAVDDDMSIDDIDLKIHQLKMKLKHRQMRLDL